MMGKWREGLGGVSENTVRRDFGITASATKDFLLGKLKPQRPSPETQSSKAPNVPNPEPETLTPNIEDL